MSLMLKNLLVTSALEIGIDISEENAEKFLILANELKKWSKKINLTSISDDREIVLKHFIDSLLLQKHLHSAANILDIGSGGGFPSLPLKIMNPHLQIVSVDSVEKKIMFQRHVARLLGLLDFRAVHSRCENLVPDYFHYFDLIVSRAFSDLIKFAGLSAPFLKKDGKIIAMKGRGGGEEVAESRSRLLDMGIIIKEIVRGCLPVSGEMRTLVIMMKEDG